MLRSFVGLLQFSRPALRVTVIRNSKRWAWEARSRSNTRCAHGHTVVALSKDSMATRQYEEGVHFQVVAKEPGTERGDLPIWHSLPRSIELGPSSSTQPHKEEVPGVPGAFVIHDLLDETECAELIGLSEAMGYTEDAPVNLGRSIRRNDNCVWVAHQKLNTQIFERAKPFLPMKVGQGRLAGLNMRWRLYRYNAGDVFKPHTDGAWPGSGVKMIKASSGDKLVPTLVRDLFGDQMSQLTFVIYLNDDFTGGETAFYLPVPRERLDEMMQADATSAGSSRGREFTLHKVPARCGSVLCFYHGFHPESPMHEGCLVSEGTKYIIRTDVLYTC